MTDSTRLRAELAEALGAYDRQRAVAVALDAVDEGSVSIDALYRILSEMLVEIGAAWQRGTAEVWQEHYATGVVRTIVEACAPRVEEQAPAGRTSTVVLAAPSDEYHDLGLRMLADRFTLAGWRAHFLGADVPLQELTAAVDELGADAVTLSASTHFHRLALKEYAAGLAESHPQVRIWVGGAAFAHEHDGWPAEMVLDPLAVPGPEDG
jgi:MerR family transcriptional regulator, light-induced transcriptional regulator